MEESEEGQSAAALMETFRALVQARAKRRREVLKKAKAKWAAKKRQEARTRAAEPVPEDVLPTPVHVNTVTGTGEEAGQAMPSGGSRNSFAVTRKGRARPNRRAAIKAKSYRVAASVKMIKRAGSIASQAEVIRALLEHPELREAVAVAGIVRPCKQDAGAYNQAQLAKMMQRARNSTSQKGGVTTDRRCAVETVQTFMAPSPVKGGDLSSSSIIPSRRARAAALGVPESSFRKVEKRAIIKRRQLSESEYGVLWAGTARRAGYSKITEELRVKIQNWILGHPAVNMRHPMPPLLCYAVMY